MPDKYKSDLSIEVLVGLFMFIILLTLGIFTIVLSRRNFLKESYPVEVVFNEVGGLREGDNVFLRGTKVGTVDATVLENNHVVVKTSTDVPVDFREGYKVEVVSSSMLGGKILKLYEGPLDAPSLPDDAVIQGEDPVEILEELASAVDAIKKMTDQIAGGEGTLGKLIAEEDIYNDLKATMSNIRQVSRGLSNGEGTIGKLLNDESVFVNLQNTVTNLSVVSTRLANGEGTLGRLLSEDDVLYNDLSASMSNIRSITDKIESGDGTLGKLVTDEQIYVEAQKLLEELRAAIDDMRETSPVTTFSTVLFGAF